MEPMRAGWIIPDWPAPSGVCAAVSTAFIEGVSEPPFGHFNLGMRSGERIERVRSNREQVQRDLGFERAPSWLHQVHGVEVLRIDTAVPSAPSDEPDADAAVTSVARLPLAILTADCLPVLFCLTDGSRVGSAHAGWRGLSAGVLENTLRALDSEPDEVMAWIGPAIGAASYEVGEEVREAFLARDLRHAACFSPTRPGHWLCDLAGLARRTLRAAGVDRIYGGGFDTFTDARFYSYRRDGARSGRFASLIWLDHA